MPPHIMNVYYNLANWFNGQWFYNKYYLICFGLFIGGIILFIVSHRDLKLTKKGRRKYIGFLSFILLGFIFELFYTPDFLWLPNVSYYLPHSILAYGCLIMGIGCLWAFNNQSKRDKGKIVCKLGPYSWDINNFCRGWSIQGKTGSGKTASAVRRIMHQLFINCPEWGGVCVDKKGGFFEDVENIATGHNMGEKIVMLKVRPDDVEANWKPPFRFNLLQYKGINWASYAKLIVDTAASLGQSSDKGFFKTQAQVNIEKALELQDILGCNPTITNVYRILESANAYMDFISQSLQDEERRVYFISRIIEDPRIKHKLDDEKIEMITVAVDGMFSEEDEEMRIGSIKVLTEYVPVLHHFVNNFSTQASEQLSGVISTIFNYIYFFTDPNMEEVFCSDHPNVKLEEVDDGKVFCVSMPQRYQTERAYINTFMKLLYYTHALKRFDKTKAERKDDNLLVFFADEAQGVITAADSGMEDSNVLDQIRETKATVVFATQSTSSYVPILKPDKTKVLLLNLSNHLFFQVADSDAAKMAADIIGKKEADKISRTRQSEGKGSISYSKEDRHIIKDYELMGMKKFETVIKHCERGYKRMMLPPVDYENKIPDWYYTLK